MSVLDLGTGTGNLAALFENVGLRSLGHGFFREHACDRTREASLSSSGPGRPARTWPGRRALNGRFDRIVSAYVWHELILMKTGTLAPLIDRHRVSQGRW